jgi:hypothetical protein
MALNLPSASELDPPLLVGWKMPIYLCMSNLLLYTSVTLMLFLYESY